MRHTIGVADMKVTSHVGESLVTYALGSCLGITVYDPVARVGGLLHVMLPTSSIDREKGVANPCMFVDTGVPRLFTECYKLGATKERMVVKVAGGACTHLSGEGDYFQIGQRNFVMLRKILWKNGVLISAYEVGGHQSRTLTLDMDSGTVWLKVDGTTKELTGTAG